MVSVAGPQHLQLDFHGTGHRRDIGGHIAVSSDNLLIYLHDQTSARLYTAAWIDAWYIASQLPETVETDPRPDHGPVMMVRAHGSDSVDHVYDPARHLGIIRIGGLTWRVHDQAAWASTRQTWREVATLAPIVLPSRRYEALVPKPTRDPEEQHRSAQAEGAQAAYDHDSGPQQGRSL